MRELKRSIAAIFAQNTAAQQQFLREQSDALIGAVEEVVRALRAGGKILLFGNGGSAAESGER